MSIEDLETSLRQAFAVRAESTSVTHMDAVAGDAEAPDAARRIVDIASVAERNGRRTPGARVAIVAFTIAAALVVGFVIVASQREAQQAVLSSVSNPPCTAPTSASTPNSVVITDTSWAAVETPFPDPQRPLVLPSLPGTCVSFVSGPRDAKDFVVGDAPAVWVDCTACEQPSKAVQVYTVPAAGADSQQTVPDVAHETVEIDGRQFFYVPSAPYWSELTPADLTMATVELVGWGVTKDNFIALAKATIEGSDTASIAGMTRAQDATNAPTAAKQRTPAGEGVVSVIVKYRRPDGAEIIFYYEHHVAAPTLLSMLPYSQNARFVTSALGPAFVSDIPGLHAVAIQPDASTLIRLASTNDSLTSSALLAIPLQATTIGGQNWAALVAAAKANGTYNS